MGITRGRLGNVGDVTGTNAAGVDRLLQFQEVCDDGLSVEFLAVAEDHVIAEVEGIGPAVLGYRIVSCQPWHIAAIRRVGEKTFIGVMRNKLRLGLTVQMRIECGRFCLDAPDQGPAARRLVIRQRFGRL